MSNKQSSVRWAIEQYSKIHSLWVLGEIGVQTFNRVYNEIIEKGDAMHKEEIINTFGVGCQVESARLIGYHKMAEQYYNETFGGNND